VSPRAPHWVTPTEPACSVVVVAALPLCQSQLVHVCRASCDLNREPCVWKLMGRNWRTSAALVATGT
jgi:hypothetical protein